MSDFRQRLEGEIAACIRDNQLKRPPPGVIGQLVALGLQLQSMPLEFAPLPYDRTPPADLDRRLLAAYREAIRAYDLETDHLKATTPPLRDDAAIASVLAYLKHWPGADSGPFSVRYADAVNIAQVSFEMMEPLRHPELKKVEAFKAVRDAFHENATAVSRRQLKRQMDGPLYPQDYDGPREQIADAYFRGTPFLNLLNEQVPYPLYDKTRYEAHWVLGEQGTGKSTFLSNLLRYDFERVKRGRCSVIIMDSQGYRGLAHNVARLPAFEKGGELEGRLIYISPRHPIALNPLRLRSTDEEYINGTIDLFEYFFGAVFDSDFTSTQGGPLRHILRAVFTAEEPSLDTFEAIVSGKPVRLGTLPEQTAKYLRDTFSKVKTNSRDGIINRLEALRSFNALEQMLNADANKLDLEAELARGVVVCIDVEQRFLKSKSLIELYGRLFIALALQATMNRDGPLASNLPPAFFYIDEAHDFIARDPRVATLIVQARKQDFGLIISNHNTTQIKDPDVKAALEGAKIHTRCIGDGAVAFHLRGEKRPTTLRIDDFKYDENAPKSARWEQTLGGLMERYGAKPPTSPRPPAAPRTSEDEPMDYSKA